MHRTLTLGLAAALVGSLAGAQTKAVLGKKGEDAEFARKLLEKGYVDLAGSLCKTITDNGASGTEQLEIQALGFELRVKEIGRDPDVAARVSALQKVIEDENAFIKENGRTNVGEVVRANLPSVYIELANTLN